MDRAEEIVNLKIDKEKLLKLKKRKKIDNMCNTLINIKCITYMQFNVSDGEKR